MKIIKATFGLALLIFIVGCESKATLLSPVDFKTAISAESSKILLDVRTPGEYSNGYINEAINIDIYNTHFDEKINALEKDKPVYVYCKSGGRSSDAVTRLAAAGFKNINELKGGLLQWQNADLPLAGVHKPAVTQFSIDDYFKEVKSSDLVLVDFYATWCGPCKMMAPHIKELHEKYPDLKVLKVDTDKSQAVARHFSISGIPLVKVYSKGEEVYDKTGYHSLDELTKVVKKYL